MIHKKLASLAVATVIGVVLIVAPAQARFGGGGMRGGGGFAGAHIGGFRGGFVRGPTFVGRSAFVNRRVFANRAFFPHRRFAFFPHRRFVGPFFGVGAGYAADYSCWAWVPTYYGVQRVWVCSNYGYGYY